MSEYWGFDPNRWALIGEVQDLKRRVTGVSGMDAIRSDQYVMTNPVTGREVPKEDLIYATRHIRELYESGRIREDRWAFLWYH
jgi:hypothetical protein